MYAIRSYYARARRERDQRSRRVEAEPGAGLRSRDATRRELFGERVSMAGDRDAGALPDGRLEGEEDHELRDPLREASDAPRAPGPDLGCREEERRHPSRAGLEREQRISYNFV